MSKAAQLPTYSAALVEAGGRASGEYYRFFQSINTNLVNYNALDARVTALEDQVPPVPSDVLGLQSIHSFGHLSEGIVRLSLVGDVDKPAKTQYYGTNSASAKGWYSLYNVVKAEVIGSTNVTVTTDDTAQTLTLDLADLVDSGIGTSFVLITRDAKGRISGTQPVTAINNVTIGATTPSSGAFTTLSSTQDATINGVTVGLGNTYNVNNLAFGTNALSSATTGNLNVAIGNNSLRSAVTGSSTNVGVGAQTLRSLTTGSGNVAIGSSALLGTIIGVGNVAVGASVLSLSTGNGNTSIGSSSMGSCTSGTFNTSIGNNASPNLTTGSNNVCIGYLSGKTSTAANTNVSGSSNTWVGMGSGPGVVTQLSNATALGNGSLNTASNQIVLGNTSVTDARVNGDWSVQNAGRGLRVAEGSNCKQGVATLAAGSVVVANTKVTATSRIILTGNADGGTPGWVRVSARTAGTSFTITSSSVLDTSTIAYQIFEPA